MDNIEKPENKKVINAKQIIGIFLFIAIIIGATYAYFVIETFNTTTKRSVSSTVEEKFAVAITGSLSMGMYLEPSHMSGLNGDVTYYATSTYDVMTEENEEVFAELSTAWEEDLTCSFKINVENISEDGFNNTATQIYNYGTTNEMVLELKKDNEIITTIDMKNATWVDNKITIDSSVSGLINGTSKVLTAKLYLNIFEYTNQSYLAGCSSSLSIYIDNIDCYRTNRT